MAATSLIARCFLILFVFLLLNDYNSSNGFKLTCFHDRFTKLVSLIKSGRFKKSYLPSRPIGLWNKHGYIIFHRPFKPDLTIALDIEWNPGPDFMLSSGTRNIQPQSISGPMLNTSNCYAALTSPFANSLCIHRRITYSRAELLHLRFYENNRPIISVDYSPCLSIDLDNNNSETKFRKSREYRGCRAGWKVRERRKVSAYSISLVITNSSRSRGPQEKRKIINYNGWCPSVIPVKLSIKPGPTSPKIIPKCMVINARSLVKPDATAALYADLHSNKIDICLISETWLNSKVPSHLVCPGDFVMIRKDRRDSRGGGGVAIICRSDWKIKIYKFGNDLECLWCKVITPNSEYYIAAVYHPPNPVYDEMDLLDYMSNTCEQIQISDPNAKIIIAGDINRLNIKDLIIHHSLQQMVKSATRGQRILDVFLSNCPFLWKTPTVFKSLVRSDHLGVLILPRVTVKPIRKFVCFRDVRAHRKYSMVKKMDACDWEKFLVSNNPCESVRLLTDSLGNIFNECFPVIKVKMSSRDPPYMSPLVKHLCNIRNKHKLNSSDTTILQERINKLIRSNQVRAVHNETRKHNRGSKGWWDTTNKITGRKSQDIRVSAIISPEIINSYFQSINTDPDYIAPERLTIPDGTRVPMLDEYSVRILLSRQKRTAPGPDNLPHWFWKDCAHHLAPVITKIFNCSLKEQTVPLLWKLANVVPVPKEVPLETSNQLRPISLTNIIMRIFERLVYKKELSAALKSSIRSDQFAYKQGQNSTMALIKCYHTWLNWLERDANFVRVFSFDFSKAFDTVSHRIVSDKLKALSINPYVINWIISFLENRKQRVTIDGVVTEFVDINRGVPQGSVLGPVLFSIMVNDIRAVNADRNLMIKFADDITLSVPVNVNDSDPSQTEVENIEEWSRDNRMTLNLSKTWEMVVRGKTSKSLPDVITTIERKNELKLLGVTFNENPCNWDSHIDLLLQKASSRMYILRVCKFYGFSQYDLTVLFDSLIMSLFLYAIEVWACAHESKYLSRIDKFLKRAARFGYTTRSISINDVIKDRDMKLWKSIIINPNHCLYELLPPERARMLRDRGHNFILPCVRTERFKRVFVNRCLFNLV